MERINRDKFFSNFRNFESLFPNDRLLRYHYAKKKDYFIVIVCKCVESKLSQIVIELAKFSFSVTYSTNNAETTVYDCIKN